jgi:multidrug efflux system outer membrane protein
MNKFYFIFISLFIAGCTVGPDYVRPKTELPKEWKNYAKMDVNVSNNLQDWAEPFNDLALSELIKKGIKNNFDVKIAMSQVNAMIGEAESIDSNFYPKINLGGSTTRTQNTASMLSNSQKGKFFINNVFGLSLSSFEIDFFGKWRRASEAAKATILQSQFIQSQVQQTLVTDICLSYFELRFLDDMLDKTNKLHSYQFEVGALTKAQFDQGVVTDIELSQAQRELLKINDQINDLKSQIKKVENHLIILTGGASDEKIPRGLKISELYSKHVTIPEGLPSDLLTRRPDILAAEQALIASNANIGFIRAQYFPSFSLTGAFGQESLSLGSILKSPQNFYNFGASVSMPLLDGGFIEGQENAAIAYKQQNIYTYKKRILSALEEVDSLLYVHSATLDKIQSLELQEKKVFNETKLINQRYVAGIMPYSSLLQSSILSLKASENISNEQYAFLSNQILLFKALGGGYSAIDTREKSIK